MPIDHADYRITRHAAEVLALVLQRGCEIWDFYICMTVESIKTKAAIHGARQPQGLI
jgi:hypothetical protein